MDFVSIEPDLVSDLEFLWRLAISSHLFLTLSKRCFDVGSGFFELIKTLINCKDVATTTDGNSEVGLISVHNFKWRVLQCRLNAVVDREFSYREKGGPVVLPLSGEEAEVLFDFFIHAFSLSIYLRMIYGH